ncbi:MAG: amidohydrolase family protein [Gemmatimonadetes bacterium]|nr:amidohydrolase family protein [Gemmatimonadota bacterium]
MSPSRRRSASGTTAAVLLVTAGLGWAVSGLSAQDLALTGATVLNPADESIRSGVLLIRDGTVVGLEDALPPGFGGEVVALDGGFVLPALADLHTHSFGNASPAGPPQMLGTQGAANAALFTGVAFVLDLFSPEAAIFAFRDRQRAEGRGGAEVLAAGPCLTAPSGHCSEYGVPTRIVDSPEAARREVSDLAQSAPDVVKIVYDNQTYGGNSMPTVDLPTLKATVATALEHGLKTVVHVGTWQDLVDAAEAGAAAVTHTPGPDPMPENVPAVLIEHGTFHIPTLAVQGDYARIVDDPSLLDDALLVATVPEGLRRAYGMEGGPPEQFEGWVGWQRTLIEPNLAAVGALAAAGVPMLTGTDAGNPAVFQGYSVHRELSLLVEAGLEPWAALRAATTDAARFLGRRWGVEPGDEATLLVVEGNPLTDIASTRRIRAVIQRGEWIDRDSLVSW